MFLQVNEGTLLFFFFFPFSGLQPNPTPSWQHSAFPSFFFPDQILPSQTRRLPSLIKYVRHDSKSEPTQGLMSLTWVRNSSKEESSCFDGCFSP